MRLSERVQNWEIEKDRRRAEAEQAERLVRASSYLRAEKRLSELLGEYFHAMREEGIAWDTDGERVFFRANGRVMCLRLAKTGKWIHWGMLNFPVHNDDEICEFFSTVLFTLGTGGTK